MKYLASAAVMLAALVSCMAGGKGPDTGRAASPPPPLNVVTFNLRYANDSDGDNNWDRRKEFLLDTIAALSPDILGTQESVHVQTQYLEAHLADYVRFGGGRNDGKESGEASCLYLRKSRFAIHDSGMFWLSQTPEIVGSKGWDALLPRVATWIVATDTATGKRVVVVNTHWDHRGLTARKESAKLIRKWLAEHAGGASIILTGDFNVTEDSPAHAVLADPAATPVLRDAYRVVHPGREKNEASFHAFRGTIDGSRIDFVFTTPDFSPTAAEIVRTQREGRYPSDHYPVRVTLNPTR